MEMDDGSQRRGWDPYPGRDQHRRLWILNLFSACPEIIMFFSAFPSFPPSATYAVVEGATNGGPGPACALVRYHNSSYLLRKPLPREFGEVGGVEPPEPSPAEMASKLAPFAAVAKAILKQ